MTTITSFFVTRSRLVPHVTTYRGQVYSFSVCEFLRVRTGYTTVLQIDAASGPVGFVVRTAVGYGAVALDAQGRRAPLELTATVEDALDHIRETGAHDKADARNE